MQHSPSRAPHSGQADAPLGFLADKPLRARQLANLYLGLYPLWCQRLGRALRDADNESMIKVAYDIRCGCSIFAARTCIELARELQAHAQAGTTGDMVEVCRRLRQSLTDLADDLRPLTVIDAEPVE